MHQLVLFSLGHMTMSEDQVLFSPPSPTWIAKRVLTDPSGGAGLEVSIGIPVYVASKDWWECPYMLAKPGEQGVAQAGVGIDAFQALVQAQESIRVALAQDGRALCWLDGEPGLTGFTRSIPITFGLGLVRHLEALVEKEEEKWSFEAAAGKYGRPYGAQ